MQNFEAAVQDNVLVRGQPWEEAPDVEGDYWRHKLSDHLCHWSCVFSKLCVVFVSLRTHSAVDEAVDLEAALDETIVETTWKRRTYPKRILPHVVHTLKAERKLMVGVRRWRWSGRCVPRPLF